MANETLFSFRVTGIESGHRNFDRPYDETFDITATHDVESVGDALNELVNRSGMWEMLDFERGFTIEYTPGDEA